MYSKYAKICLHVKKAGNCVDDAWDKDVRVVLQNEQLGSKGLPMFWVFVNQEWLEGPIYPTGIGESDSSAKQLSFTGSAKLETLLSLKDFTPAYPAVVQYAVMWEQPSSDTVLPPFSQCMANQTISKYVWTIVDLDALQQVNIAVITPDSMICAFDLCICTVLATIKV